MDETTRVQAEGHLTMCGLDCSSGQAGHGLLPVQQVVAAAAPSAWRDGIVAGRQEGTLILSLLDGGSIALWHHTDAGASVGDPVAYHPIAGVLAVSEARLSVRSR